MMVSAMNGTSWKRWPPEIGAKRSAMRREFWKNTRAKAKVLSTPAKGVLKERAGSNQAICLDSKENKFQQALNLLTSLNKLVEGDPEKKRVVLPVARSFWELSNKIEQKGLQKKDVAEFIDILLEELTSLNELLLEGEIDEVKEISIFLLFLEGEFKRADVKMRGKILEEIKSWMEIDPEEAYLEMFERKLVDIIKKYPHEAEEF